MTPASPSASDAVTVVLPNEQRQVTVGTRLSELLPSAVAGLPVVAALVDRRAVSLNDRVMAAISVEPLTTHHWEGLRVFRQSLGLLVLEACGKLRPELQVRMGSSVGFAQRIIVPALAAHDMPAFADALEAKMHELIAHPCELRELHWTLAQAREHFHAAGADDAVQLLLTWRDSSVPVVSYGSVYAFNMGPLLPSTRELHGFYIAYDDNVLLLVYGRRAHLKALPTRTMPLRALHEVGEVSEPPPSRESLATEARSIARQNHNTMFEEEAWLRALEVTSVGAFNRACVQGSVPDFIRVCEGFHEKRISRIADAISERVDDVDVVCISGPSSSGKTTFIRRLKVQLQVNGIRPIALGLDDYYIDRELTPKDESGDYDYEALEAIHLERLQEHVLRLLNGETVVTPRYDFVSGKSIVEGGHSLALGERDVLLMEGIHGLNPALLGPGCSQRVFRVFVCPFVQLGFDHLSRVHASDVRLIRRIVRDRHSRSSAAAQTIARWPKVRIGERRHIFPYQGHADTIFDTSLIYELNVLKVYAERYLLEVPHDHPSYTTAFRLMHLLDRFVSIYPDHVPTNSILREFIGGSSFEY